MKIMRVVYSVECEHSDWDGENVWSVGDKFNGEYAQGLVTEMAMEEGALTIWVDGKIAMTISPHAVQRVYYGEK